MAQVSDVELHKYWDLLDQDQKRSILDVIKSFLLPGQKAARVSIDQYNKEIDEAMSRINAGEFTSQEDLEKETENW